MMKPALFIDSHCHLHDSRILADLPGILARARENDVRFMVTCATMEENFEFTARLAKTCPSILPCFGIHPWFLDSLSSEWEKNLARHLTACASGVGETGLDFADKTLDRDLQVRVFESHLRLAIDLGRPVTIHVRKAWDPLIHILKKYGKLRVPGLVHSYSGSAELIPVLESYNLYISFSGSVTYPKARRGILCLQKVLPDRLVLETDTPDIYPFLPGPRPSLFNEPMNLEAIARIAAIRSGMEFETLVARAYENSRILFRPLLTGKQT